MLNQLSSLSFSQVDTQTARPDLISEGHLMGLFDLSFSSANKIDIGSEEPVRQYAAMGPYTFSERA